GIVLGRRFLRRHHLHSKIRRRGKRGARENQTAETGEQEAKNDAAQRWSAPVLPRNHVQDCSFSCREAQPWRPNERCVYDLLRRRFLWRFSFMRLRLIGLEFFAFRRFFSVLIEVSRV